MYDDEVRAIDGFVDSKYKKLKKPKKCNRYTAKFAERQRRLLLRRDPALSGLIALYPRLCGRMALGSPAR
jgi:hypothetical protein